MNQRTGNQFWKARTRHGRKAKFATPEVLWAACEEYFEWVDANPLMATEVVKYQGEATLVEVPKMRAMTILGMCVFLGINHSTWREYVKKEGFSQVTSLAENIIRTQKFEGASADLLNANIIARDLGLADKSDLTVEGKLASYKLATADPQEAAEAYQKMIDGGVK